MLKMELVPTENSVNVPAFLGKLWKMVNDPKTDHLICWNAAGNSFVIQNQAQFWYELLPVYYKHNNMSSFVRQLNMYDFHKVSSVDNGTMDADRDEIIFYHPYFQKDRVDLLRNIKRKVTIPKPMDGGSHTVIKSDEISKVLVDVKQIRGRQASVDAQLSALKSENGRLWYELTQLREQHSQQQQIVNKLIHFLISFIHSTRTGTGVGLKRTLPLMLCDKPTKKRKIPKSKLKKPEQVPKRQNGPTIHELDADLEPALEFTPEELYEEQIDDDTPLIHSPVSSTSSKADSANGSRRSRKNLVQDDKEPAMIDVLDEGSGEAVSPEMLWDKPDLFKSGECIVGEDGEIMGTLQNLEEGEAEAHELADSMIQQAPTAPDFQNIFLNPNAQDTLLSNLISGNYNFGTLDNTDKKINEKKVMNKNTKKEPAKVDRKKPVEGKSLTVATKEDVGNTVGNDVDLDMLHSLVGSTQTDLDQLKDVLATCNGFDANALLSLFNDESPEYGLSLNQNNKEGNNSRESTDPLLSGSELAPYGINVVDFNELFDTVDVDDSKDYSLALSPKDLNLLDSALNTPQIEPGELTFPSSSITTTNSTTS